MHLYFNLKRENSMFDIYTPQYWNYSLKSKVFKNVLYIRNIACEIKTYKLLLY